MTAANEAPELLLQHHLKKLRLPTVLREYEKLPGNARPRMSIMSATWHG